MQSKHTPAANIALGGVLAALAVVVMSMGTLIPVATYVCPYDLLPDFAVDS